MHTPVDVRVYHTPRAYGVPKGMRKPVPRRARRQFAHLFLVLLLPLLPLRLFGTTISGADGLTVTVESNGNYLVAVPALGWSLGGSVGGAISNVAVGSSADGAGGYSEISFDLRSDAARHATIRAYGSRHAVLFTVTNDTAVPNTFSFPNLTQYPQKLQQLTYSGAFSPPLFSGAASDSPWIFFDSARNTFILSPAENFMVASTVWGPKGELASGIAPQIPILPQGFHHQTLLVLESGINQAFDTWGGTLTALQGKSRPPNDVDPILNQVGYWTDNGSAYYYRSAPGLSYEQTLSSIKADFDGQGIALGYMQLDSWFYPKGSGAVWNDGANGIYEYVADSTLFPQGLAAFQREVSVPLVTHARWIDSSSPYRRLYQMSGNVVVDPPYWSSTAGYLASSGVATYEQDWLDGNAQTNFNLTDPAAFLDNMAAAMAQRNLTVQYSMASPRHLLQSSKYGNLTTVRTSYDRFARDKWTHFLYTSRLASSLGAWPFTDVFMSTELDNLLVATLSAGPVGIGDPIGALSAKNLLRAVRQDGVIVKPDVPLTPIDSSFLNAAGGVDAPQIDASYSDFGALRTYYIFTYSVGSNRDATFSPADWGVHHPVYLYDYFSGTGRVVEPSDVVSTPLLNDTSYFIAAPIGPSGIAVIGDTGQFVTMGKKRIAQMSDDGVVRMTVAFAEGEKSRTIRGYSLTRPIVWADTGAVGHLTYDSARHLFQVAVTPGHGHTASIGIGSRHRLSRRRPPLIAVIRALRS